MLFAPQFAKDTPSELDWRVIPIPRGSVYRCWSAGPIVPVWCHYVNKASKPCWSRITKGQLICPWCGKIKLRNIGYLPTFAHPDGKRRVIILSKTTMKPVRDVPFCTPLIANQAQVPNQPAVVRVEDVESMRGHAWKQLRKRDPEDITPYLVRKLWCVPEIAEFFGVELWTDE
jgi:hypothetical protein